MLPLTSSLYVTGELATNDSVLVDVGTGYWVEMNAAAGADYCRRKVNKLRSNVESLSTVIRDRQNAMMQVSQLIAERQAALAAAGGAPTVAAPTVGGK
jgi:prefoldin alpha subunit